MKQIDEFSEAVVPSFDAEEFKRKTERKVVYATFKRPKGGFSYNNPDPYGYFPGRKGDRFLHLIKWPSDLTDYTNCYAFACGWTVKDDKFGSEIYQPGFLSGLDPETHGDYLNAVIADLKAVGREVYEVYDAYNCPKKLPKAEKGSYWIKILFASEHAYHMMRKDEESGKWVHKAGWKQRPKVVLRQTIGTKEDDKDSKSKYETRDRANYLSYREGCGSFIVFQFTFALRIQK